MDNNKKSKKISIFYIISSLSLLALLVFAGVYGLYISVGLSFMRSNVSNLAEGGGVRTVSYGIMSNYESSMTGVIILSIAIIVLSIFDIVSLFKQIHLFKQFNVVQKFESKFGSDKKIRKTPIIAFAVIVDLLSIGLGIAGIFVNSSAFSSTNMTWVIYLIDALVSLFGAICLVLLIAKVVTVKKNGQRFANKISGETADRDTSDESEQMSKHASGGNFELNAGGGFGIDVDKIGYNLLKLKNLKSMKMISDEEFNLIRKKLLNFESGAEDKNNDDDYCASGVKIDRK